MHIHRVKSKQGKKVYEQILLRESYREPGAGRSTVKKRTLLNLTRYPTELVQAIELALKHKKNLAALCSTDDIKFEQGPSVGGVFVLAQLAKRLGITNALGHSNNGKLALWQIIARVLGQGSRLSAVRLAKTMAVSEATGIKQDFCEDHL